jgi:hypothetical protein
MHRALPAPVHQRMKDQDVDEDHRVEAEHPQGRAAAFPLPPCAYAASASNSASTTAMTTNAM